MVPEWCFIRARRHPDKNGNSEEAKERFQKINAAYMRLTGADESDDELDDVDVSDFFSHDDIFDELFGAMGGGSMGFFFSM